MGEAAEIWATQIQIGGPLDPRGVIGTVRRFNRFYFPLMGSIATALTADGFSLAELRVFRELGRTKWGSTSAWLVHSLGVDPGYVSRIVRKFRDHGWIRESPAPHDARIKEIDLTERGRHLLEGLERCANIATARILADLTADQHRRLIAAMETIEEILGNPELPRDREKLPRAPVK